MTVQRQIATEWELQKLDSEMRESLEELVGDRESITYDELLSLLPEAEEDVELLDAVIEELFNMGVTIIDGTEETEEKTEAEGEIGPAAEEEELLQEEEAGVLENIPADDLLSVYLAEMAQEPLLTHDEEIELAQEIELGLQAEQAIRETDYTAEEYERLQAQVEAGQASRERLGRANTRLVVSIAKRYRGSGIPFTDLIQNGNVGLMRAVDRYDYRTGNRFSTYATWWIRQAVTRSLANQGRIIRIPVHTGGRMRKMAQVAQRLEKEQGERPTPEEVAAEMDESPEKVRQMMRWATRPISLELPVGEEGDAELGDFIAAEEMAGPEERTDAQLLNETVDRLLKELSPREARVLRLRYGLEDGKTRTLKEIAEKFGLSRERIRQIEREALAKIRLVAPEYRLQHFLEEA
jgi:RNA polymerase primary sigma factor